MQLDPELIWIWKVRADAEQSRALRVRLSASERARADRLRLASDRESYICAHAALRTILGDLLDLDPDRLEFNQGDHGKPSLATRTAFPLEFNLSHSRGLALVAVSSQRSVGVDVERVIEQADLVDVAERFFSPKESAALRTLQPGERTPAFYRLWTRKESYLKALGVGLAAPTASFSVPIERSEDLLAIDSTEEQSREFRVRSVDVGAGYAAAVSARGTNWRIEVQDWSPQCSNPE